MDNQIAAITNAGVCGDCRNCGGGGWVCENHPDRPWDGTSRQLLACGCGAGAPCPVCSPDMAFEGRRVATILECAAVAFAPFDWRFGEAPRTYRALANRIGAEIRQLQFVTPPSPPETPETGGPHV